jgi:hypothetical protein
MGNPDRCPECNRFGTAELEGYCKDCYPNIKFLRKDVFMDRLFAFQEHSQNVVTGALKEVGAESADKVKPEDRSVVLNICRRRLPTTRQRHLVQKETFVSEGDYFGFRKHGESEVDDYRVVKGGYEVERD